MSMMMQQGHGPAPDLPVKLKEHLAMPGMREHHAMWHYVRTSWLSIDDDRKKELHDLGWEPTYLQGEPLSGIDFLGMHRMMLHHARQFAKFAGLQADLTAWNPIPWRHDDPVWPIPMTYDEVPNKLWKQQAATDSFRKDATDRFLSDEWLRGHSLDYLGTQIENGIHAWMHVHWSAKPWYSEGSGKDINDPNNDWLASPYSSHVNKHFWKLHAWIDDRVAAWKAANPTRSDDLSDAWVGPMHDMGKQRVMTPEEIRIADATFTKPRFGAL